ncbi:odorant receptor 4-like [Megachile rotundata]|uniref:odorant receptor 4-like n=1 Tax=Megachile rotundata TaxID=143995 RepID=UPI003FD3ADA7
MVYTDFSIETAKLLLKFAGACFATNKQEELQLNIALFCLGLTVSYSVYENFVNIYHYWENDKSYSVYASCNVLCTIMAASKILVLRIRRLELENILADAERHFWHWNYNSEEQLLFSECRLICKYFIMFVLSIPPASLFGYVITPIVSNIGKNKSERILPLDVWFNFPSTETPYYEFMFTFQIISVFLVGTAYVSPDTLLCILNLHVIYQFRMLHYRMLRLWKRNNGNTDATKYAIQCSEDLRKCVNEYQSLIEFCENMEHVFSRTLLIHVAIFSVLMGFDGYEILLSNAPLARRCTFIFHVAGSFIHLGIFTFSCSGLTEESSKISTIIYFGSWSTLPMDQIGKSIRSKIIIVMMRTMRPCCLTAGGFFPVSLKTFTTVTSSSYYSTLTVILRAICFC